ncbi:MAG: hypothetical protein M3R02_19140 [Chloroflexota bacterium]|nr:hypothetical protein [Chloroflexota bacterium]
MATEIRDGIHPGSAPAHRALTPELLNTDREATYHHWAHVSGQNAAETARALGLSPRTVQDWAQREGWRHRLDAERKDQTARVWSVAELALLRAVPDAIQSLARIARGDGDLRQHVTKDGDVVEIVEFVPYMARVNAVNSLLDRFGLTSIQRHQHQVAPAPSAPTHPASTGHDTTATPTTPLTREAAARMTPEERAAWERHRRQQQAG